ncbi:hypothetical protein [Bradyrhizobium diazoefficiens]|uniref:hypothetical protein n=1 Tax=Bradyrhizobium diazoefficiens TaxID=1355477 RepID=UPI001AED3CBF|nr:hypothetical protein [Bradyrhizobium diazoefficiens]
MLEAAESFFRRRPRRGRYVESLQRDGCIRKSHGRIELESVRKPVMKGYQLLLRIDRGIPLRRLPGRHASEEKLMHRDRAKKDIPAHRPAVASQEVFRHADAGEELIATFAKRLQLRKPGGKQVRQPDRRRSLQPDAVLPEIKMRRLVSVKARNGR